MIAPRNEGTEEEKAVDKLIRCAERVTNGGQGHQAILALREAAKRARELFPALQVLPEE